jgi:hypothetical protein
VQFYDIATCGSEIGKVIRGSPIAIVGKAMQLLQIAKISG